MQIHVDGNRSSSENWMRAQAAPPQTLPELSPEQRKVASRLGVENEAYARGVLAGDLERRELEEKAEKAARLIERLASRKVPGVLVESVWLKTFDGKFRFELESCGRRTLIFVVEDLVNNVLESGSEQAEVEIGRILDAGLPGSWIPTAS